jgi:hypothetical protein
VAASLWIDFIPLYVLAFLALLLGVLALLGRISGGKYLRPIVQFLSKVPLVRTGLKKASEAAMERQNPALASAMKKFERHGALNNPQRAQQVMSQLTPAERKAWLDAAAEQGALQPMNREQRRQLERMQRRSGGGKRAKRR